jgi:AraC-like DNA-binding protein
MTAYTITAALPSQHQMDDSDRRVPGRISRSRAPCGSPRAGVGERACRAAEAPGQGSTFTFEQLLASAEGELAHLAAILRVLGCSAELHRVQDQIPTNTETTAFALRADAPGEPAIRAVICDAQGYPYASLSIISDEIGRSVALDRLLRALLASAAAAIAERWFRMHYRRHWIVAAQCRGGPEGSLLLAVDCEQRLVGADHSARQILHLDAELGDLRAKLSDCFVVGATVVRDTPGADVALKLVGCRDGKPYSVLITSPDPSAMYPHQNQRLLLHTRPRRDVIVHREQTAPQERQLLGLPLGRLRHIQEYIDANLESALRIEDLAACAGLSASYFSRSFSISVGITPGKYVLRRRLLRAQELLEHTQLSLVEIAVTTGFADQSHFTRRFHEVVGVPPKVFRTHHR